MVKHFAFVSDPAAGHINPTLPLVRELVSRGHRVSYGTSPRFGPAVEAAGAAIVPLPCDEAPRPATSAVSSEDMVVMLENILRDTGECFPVLDEQFEKDPPDAVCFDVVSFAGRVLAEKINKGRVALIPTFAGNEKFPVATLFVAKSFDAANPRLRELDQQMRQFAAGHNVTINPNPLKERLAPLNIVFVPKVFQLAAETFDDGFHFVGPSVRSWEDTGGWRPPGDGRPVLYISLGTALNDRPEFFRMCLDAFADSAWHVVIALGDRVTGEDLGAVPENFDVRPYFPQQSLLPHADVFVSHLGMGSTMDALYFGVPLVGMPLMPESHVVARRVEELGLGVSVDHRTLTAEGLVTAVTRVAKDPVMRANMEKMSQRTQQAGGAVAAADAIETYL